MAKLIKYATYYYMSIRKQELRYDVKAMYLKCRKLRLENTMSELIQQ